MNDSFYHFSSSAIALFQNNWPQNLASESSLATLLGCHDHFDACPNCSKSTKKDDHSEIGANVAIHLINHLLQHTDICVPFNGGKPAQLTQTLRSIQPATRKGCSQLRYSCLLAPTGGSLILSCSATVFVTVFTHQTIIIQRQISVNLLSHFCLYFLLKIL